MKSLLILCGTAFMVYVIYKVYRFQTLDNGLPELVRKGAVILDVRTEKEYATGHIEGSVNISLGTIRERYMELDPKKTYITVCSHGLRSVKVENILKEKGFQQVYNGGAWTDLQKTLSQ
ncbi:rhodanese-related sulfurtransferase [Chryseobacterium bernardetii]|jgi:rhodanese-related sulfurtransferase|uniref:Rhodanese-related sulfurtransferase n=2 Tax=Chryseobacterium TaxID=59732 RepID=A0A543EJ13_9FLAO|nr:MULTISPECIES: rhodanese-like domain-containing protein [Chryseobacterium]MDR6369978.1 rhodanese-related sulfurtransferase [Chryseobacterium vietnamense]MDR6440779.1 rhodanese-related sulfurtransferase [Chryseobacterium bernardetii]MDR6486718.1 rhodanese-related sulfurtransferase [Chryseobacterium vietnamense]TQM21542.1 rhodanese-related sulfurtransferase [Chryseobacterium aquifrigidense]